LEPETATVTLRLCAVVTLADAGVTVTVGVTGCVGGVVEPPPLPQPLKNGTKQIAIIKANMLNFMLLIAPEVLVLQS
jgi:hypothetical protein